MAGLECLDLGLRLHFRHQARAIRLDRFETSSLHQKRVESGRKLGVRIFILYSGSKTSLRQSIDGFRAALCVLFLVPFLIGFLSWFHGLLECLWLTKPLIFLLPVFWTARMWLDCGFPCPIFRSTSSPISSVLATWTSLRGKSNPWRKSTGFVLICWE